MDEYEKLKKLVDEFSEQMYLKLTHKTRFGWAGWDEPEFLDVLKTKIKEHLARRDMLIKGTFRIVPVDENGDS